MSIVKAEIKKAVFHTLGCDADDWLEGAKRQGLAYEGAKQALRQSAQQVQSLQDRVMADLDEGKLEGLAPLQVAEYAKLQVERAVNSLLGKAQHFENLQLSSSGEVIAYERLVKHFVKLHDTEAERSKQLQAAVAAGTVLREGDSLAQAPSPGPSARIPGTRPAPSIAAQRKAQEAPKQAPTKKVTPKGRKAKR